jgi:hypothetical protein
MLFFPSLSLLSFHINTSSIPNVSTWYTSSCFYFYTNNIISTASTCHSQWLSFTLTPTLSHDIYSHIITLSTHIETNTIPTVSTCHIVILPFTLPLVLSRTNKLPYFLHFSCQVFISSLEIPKLYPSATVSLFPLMNFHRCIPFFFLPTQGIL